MNILNFINYLLVLSFVLFFFKENKIRYILFLSSLSPFILFLIIPENLWPDQKQYVEHIVDIRNLNFSYNSWAVFKPSIFLAIIPIPFTIDTISIALINKLLFFIIIYFWIKYYQLTYRFLFIIILLPSSILISTLALKDMLVFFFMFFSIHYFLKNQYLFSLVSLLIIYFIKFQNAFFMLIIFLNYYFIVSKHSYKFKFFFLSILIVCIYLRFDLFINLINTYSKGFFFSSFSEISQLQFRGEVQYYYENIEVKNIYDLFYKILTRSFAFFLAPLSPYKLIHFFQIFENVIIVLIIFYLFILSKKRNKLFMFFFWLLSILLIFGIYGMAVYNYGTIVRYRYPFILLLFIFCYNNILDSKNENNINFRSK